MNAAPSGSTRVAGALIAITVLLVGCAGDGAPSGSDPSGSDPSGSDASTGDEQPDADASSADDTEVAGVPDPRAWDDVLAAAEGSTLSLHMWGGSTEINGFVDRTYGDALAELGVTLSRIPLADTADAVNAVLAELDAGRDAVGEGSIDLIWLNAENFATMRQAGALLEPGWAEHLPRAALVDWTDPAVAFDAGLPVEFATSPWGSAQFQFVHDPTRPTTGEQPPRSYAQLADWIEANPGRFTYPAPPAFHGTRFLTQWFHELDGDPDAWVDGFDEARYEQVAEELFGLLLDLEPDLWRGGSTYPGDIADLDRLFANAEVDVTFTQLPAGIGANIDAGVLPATARPYVFDTGTIGDHHYLAIPVNAPDPAAAMVFADLVLAPELQAAKLDPAGGWGDGIAIDAERLPDADREAIDAVVSGLADTAVDPDELAAVRTPNPSATLTTRLEADWDRVIRQGRPLSER